MKMRRRMGYALCGCGIVAGGAHAAIKGSTKPPQERVMPALIEQYSADLESIEGTYVVRTSAVRSAGWFGSTTRSLRCSRSSTSMR